MFLTKILSDKLNEKEEKYFEEDSNKSILKYFGICFLEGVIDGALIVGMSAVILGTIQPIIKLFKKD